LPYVLLGVLAIGTWFGVRFGLIGTGTSKDLPGPAPLRSISPCSLVPASSVGGLINRTVVGTRISATCEYVSVLPSGPGVVPPLSVRVSGDAKAVADIKRLLDPKTKTVLDGKIPPAGLRRHFADVDGTPAVWQRSVAIHGRSPSITISAVRRSTLVQVTVGGMPDSYLVADEMMEIALGAL